MPDFFPLGAQMTAGTLHVCVPLLICEESSVSPASPSMEIPWMREFGTGNISRYPAIMQGNHPLQPELRRTFRASVCFSAASDAA